MRLEGLGFLPRPIRPAADTRGSGAALFDTKKHIRNKFRPCCLHVLVASNIRLGVKHPPFQAKPRSAFIDIDPDTFGRSPVDLCPEKIRGDR